MESFPAILWVMLLNGLAVSGTFAIPLSRTLAIIRPEVMYKDALIMAEFMSTGFQVKHRSVLTLDKSATKKLFTGKFPDQPINAVTEAWTAQSLTVYVLERRSAVAMGKAVLGPEDPAVARSSAPHSIRAKYGISATRNAVYSSRNLDEANRDISFFFPQAQGNVGIETEHRLMDFDVSDLYPEVPLSSMSWLNPHERGQVETMEDSIMHTETDEDILTEPALALRMLTDEYIQGLSESVRHAVQERIQILDEAADAGGNSGSCSHSTTHEANNEFLSFLSPHLEM